MARLADALVNLARHEALATAVLLVSWSASVKCGRLVLVTAGELESMLGRLRTSLVPNILILLGVLAQQIPTTQIITATHKTVLTTSTNRVAPVLAGRGSIVKRTSSAASDNNCYSCHDDESE